MRNKCDRKTICDNNVQEIVVLVHGFNFSGLTIFPAFPAILPPANEVCEGYVLLFTPVCHSVHRGVCLCACWDTLPRADIPWTRHTLPPGRPLWADTIPGTRHPQAQCMLGNTDNKRAVHILLKCILVYHF